MPLVHACDHDVHVTCLLDRLSTPDVVARLQGIVAREIAPAATGRMPEDVLSNHSPHVASLIEPTLSAGVTAFVAAREWLG